MMPTGSWITTAQRFEAIIWEGSNICSYWWVQAQYLSLLIFSQNFNAANKIIWWNRCPTNSCAKSALASRTNSARHRRVKHLVILYPHRMCPPHGESICASQFRFKMRHSISTRMPIFFEHFQNLFKPHEPTDNFLLFLTRITHFSNSSSTWKLIMPADSSTVSHLSTDMTTSLKAFTGWFSLYPCRENVPLRGRSKDVVQNICRQMMVRFRNRTFNLRHYIGLTPHVHYSLTYLRSHVTLFSTSKHIVEQIYAVDSYCLL